MFSGSYLEQRRLSGVHRKHTRREVSKGGRDLNLALITPEAQNNTEYVAQLGGTANIRCYTHFLGDELVG